MRPLILFKGGEGFVHKTPPLSHDPCFLLGLGISVVLLIGGYFYYRSNLALLESEIKTQAMEEARMVFNEEYPMSIVYVLQHDKRAGKPFQTPIWCLLR